MKTKTYLLAGLLTLAGAVVAHADSLVDTWTVDGGAFNAANQTNYTTGAGGTWKSDQVIASDGSGSGATLAVGAVSGGGAGFGSNSDYFYTSGSTPTFTLASDTVLSDVATITVSLTAAGLSSFDANTLSLDFNGSTVTVGDFSSIATGGKIAGFDAYTYTYSWDVSSFATGSDSFDIAWTDNGQHTAFNAVTLTQAAVPEPATYAAIFGGLVLAGAMLRRRFTGRSSC